MIVDIVISLSLTGGHYINDFLFGAVAACGSFYMMQKYGYTLNFYLLKGYTKVMCKFESESVS